MNLPVNSLNFGSAHKVLDEPKSKACYIGLVAEDSERHDRMASQPAFVDDEQDCHERPDRNQADHLWRIPRVGCTTKVETQQQHDHQSDHGKTASPVDRFDTFRKFCSGVVHV